MLRSPTKLAIPLLSLALHVTPTDAYAQHGRGRPTPTVSPMAARCEQWQSQAQEEVAALTQEAHQAMGECMRCTSSYASADARQCTQVYREDLIGFLRHAATIRDALREGQDFCQANEVWDLRHQAVQIRRRVHDAYEAARQCDFHWYHAEPSEEGGDEPPQGGGEPATNSAPAWLGFGLYGVLPGFSGPSNGAIGFDVVALRAMTNPASRPRFDLGLRGELGLTLDRYGWRLGTHDGAARVVAGLEGRLMLGAGNEGVALAATVAYSGLFPGFPGSAPPLAISGHGIVLRGGGEYYFGPLGIALNGELWAGSSTVGEPYYLRYGLGLGFVVQTGL